MESSCTLHLDTISPNNSTLIYLKWHFFNLKFSQWHICITILTFCCGLCHQHHNLQLIYHQQCRKHLTGPWIFHLIFWAGKSEPLVVLKMVVLQTCTCQIYMQRWLNRKICHSVSGDGILNWHLLVKVACTCKFFQCTADSWAPVNWSGYCLVESCGI